MKILISLALVLSAATSFASVDDLAINVKTGDNAFTARSNNAKGLIYFTNDQDESFKQTIPVLSYPSKAAKFEIEMPRANQVTYLVRQGSFWMLGTIRKVAGQWEKLPMTNGVSGHGLAKDLTSLPDGRMALSVKRPGQDEEVLLIENNDSVLTVVESMSMKAVAEKMNTLSVPSTTPETVTYEVTSAGSTSGTQQGIGFAAGATTGVGISYRRHLANKFGYQVTGILFGSSTSFFGSAGINVLRTLHKTKKTRFLAIAGVSTFYSADNQIDWEKCRVAKPTDYEDPNFDPCAGVDPTWQHDLTVNLGIGIGMEFMVSENIGLALELPFVISVSSEDFSVYPIPNASLIYYF